PCFSFLITRPPPRSTPFPYTTLFRSQATPSQLDRRLRDVAPEELIRRPAPEKWSIAEIVAHLADAELAMGWRLRNMLANPGVALDRKSTRLNSSHEWISYAVFCLKKK